MAQDHYQTLGVGRDASPEDIKKAYRRLAKRYHPDRNPGDAEAERKFKEVSTANDVLSNPQKRAQYDQFGGESPFAGAGAGAGAGFDGIDLGDVGQIFEGIFGGGFSGGFGGGRSRGAREPRTGITRVAVELELAEALRGVKRQLQLELPVACEECDGKGAAPGSKPEICPHCDGSGELRAAQGFFSIQRTCSHCRGEGRVIADPCRACRGRGRVSRKRAIDIDIPAGVDHGMNLRLSGEGGVAARGGARGDLLVEIHVRPHRMFERDGANLHCRLPLSFGEAALGAEIEMPTFDGRVAIKVPPGTKTGATLRAAGKGAPALRGARRGDLLCHVEVCTPQKPDKRQKELLRELRDIEEKRPSPERKSWLKDIGDFFA